MRSTTLLALFSTVVGNAAASSLYERQTAANCSELELVIARGTDEPVDPSFGYIVGDPLFAATKKLIPGVTGYEVPYPASLACNSSELGVQYTLEHLKNASQACPQQKFVLVGYSQGAGVMHGAAPNISTSLYPSIVALVMFGDPGNLGPNFSVPRGVGTPDFPSALQQKLKENCALGDPVCSNGTTINAHLSYDAPDTTYIADSAAYIQKQFQTDGKAGPESSPNGGAPNAANQQVLSSFASLLGATATAPSCPGASTAGSSSNSSTTATTTNGSPSSSAGVASPTATHFTGGAMRLSPFGGLLWTM